MNTKKRIFLLPHRCQLIGWIIASAAFLVMVVPFFLGLESTQLVRFMIFGALFLYVGLFLVGFSREKTEDEFTLHLRTSSALTAMLVICALRILFGLVIGTLWARNIIGKESHDLIKDATEGFTGFGSVFILYLILYKARLARYNKEAGHEE